MITDEDRRALAYFRAHPRGIRVGDLSAAQRAHFDDLLARSSSAPARAWSASRWTASPPPAASRSCTSPGPAAPPSTSRTTSASRAGVTLIEFDNAEDNANHVHSVWRDPSNDFGADLLMQHHLDAPHGGQHQ